MGRKKLTCFVGLSALLQCIIPVIGIPIDVHQKGCSTVNRLSDRIQSKLFLQHFTHDVITCAEISVLSLTNVRDQSP